MQNYSCAGEELASQYHFAEDDLKTYDDILELTSDGMTLGGRSFDETALQDLIDMLSEEEAANPPLPELTAPPPAPPPSLDHSYGIFDADDDGNDDDDTESTFSESMIQPKLIVYREVAAKMPREHGPGYLIFAMNSCVIGPLCSVEISSGIHVKFDKDYYASVVSADQHTFSLFVNSKVYYGNNNCHSLKVAMFNSGQTNCYVNAGDAIGILILHSYHKCNMLQAN